MVKFGKWIGGALGWTLGGPIGAIIGFIAGSAVDNTTLQEENTSQYQHQTGTGDFVISLLILSAEVMKADGKTMKSELNFVKQFLQHQFGKEKSEELILRLKDILLLSVPLQEVCMQIKQHMDIASRLQLIHYLFGISKADGHVHKKEVIVIERIAYFLNISDSDYKSIRAMYFKDVNADYTILEISPEASDDDLKKAYRKMAVKYHPDKVLHLGEDVQKAAKEKFQRVQEAYENIKKERNI